MSPPRTIGRSLRIVKVLGWIATHAHLVHDSARRGVTLQGKGYDLGQTEPLEAVSQGSHGGLGSVAASPELTRQAPAGLYSRRKMVALRYVLQPDEAYERRDAWHLNRPEAKPMNVDMPSKKGRFLVALRA